MKKLVIAAISSTLLSLVSEQSGATVISFDDLPAGADTRILDRYANLHWLDIGVLNGSSQKPDSGYYNSVMSAPNIAYTYGNRAASFSNEYAFSLVSMGVTKAIRGGITHFDAYLGNQLRYSRDVYSTPSTPQLVIFNWDNITKVVISDGDGSFQTAFDNVTVTGVVSEPHTTAMLLTGLGAVALVARRRAPSPKRRFRPDDAAVPPRLAPSPLAT